MNDRLPKGILMAKTQKGLNVLARLYDKYGVDIDSQAGTIYDAFMDVLDKNMKLEDYPKILVEKLKVHPDTASAFAGELFRSLLNGLDDYFEVEDIFGMTKKWMERGVGDKFNVTSKEGADTPIAESLEKEDLRGVAGVREAARPIPRRETIWGRKRDDKGGDKEPPSRPNYKLDKNKLHEMTLKLLDQAGVGGLSEEVLGRVENIVFTQIKDVRDVTEATIMYKLPIDSGGVGLPHDKASVLASLLEEKLRKHEIKLTDVMEKSGEIKLRMDFDDLHDPWEEYEVKKDKELDAVKGRVVSEQEKAAKDMSGAMLSEKEKLRAPERGASSLVDILKKKDKPKDEAQKKRQLNDLLSHVVGTKTKSAQKSPSTVRSMPKKNAASLDAGKQVGYGGTKNNVKNVVDNVRKGAILPSKNKISKLDSGVKKSLPPKPTSKPVPAGKRPSEAASLDGKNKVGGELRIKNIDDLGSLTPSMLRMYGEKLENIEGRIEEIVKKELKSNKDSLLRVWESSDLYKTYLEVGKQSIFTGKPVDDIAKMHRANHKQYLQKDEFELVAKINNIIQEV